MMRCRAALLALFAVAIVAPPASSGAGDSCPTRVIGIKTSLANTNAALILGEGVGQTFYAPDTPIRSLTVWQPASWSSGLQLYVQGTSPTGVPLYEDILAKASLTPIAGDGVSPIPYVFEFNPPLQLPHTGVYGFMLFSCSRPGRLLTFSADSASAQLIYPDGHAWDERHRYACRPTTRPTGYPGAHLIFQIVFQHSTTPEPIVLETSQTDSCRVRLVWSDGGTGASSATVMRHTTGAGWDSIGIAQADGLGRFTFEDATAALNTRYDYRLVVDECRFGGECEVVTSDELAVPIVLETAQTDSCWVRLVWSDGGTGASSATVMRRTTGAAWDSIGIAQADGLGRFTFEDATAALNTRYHYRLSVDKCRFGGECEVVTSDGLAVRFAGAELAERGVRLTWLADSPGTPPVTVYRRGVTIDAQSPVDETWRAIGTGDFGSTGRLDFEDPNVTGGARYQYRLAVTRCGHERSLGLTPNVDFPPVDTPCAPPVVPPLVSEPTNCGLRLSWSWPYLGRRAAALYQRPSEGDWTFVGVVTSDGTGQSLYEDLTARAGEHRVYRLGTRDCAAERFSNEVAVEVNGAVATDAIARVEPDQVSVSWSVSALAGTPVTIYRRTADTDWQAVAQVEIDATHVVRFQDARTSPAIPDGLRYRLGIVRCGREGLIGEVSAVVPGVYELAIIGLRPNPTERDLVVSFTLPDDQPARIDVLDVAGRRILSRDVGQLGPGGQAVNLTEGRTLRSGMYVIRLSHAGQVRTTRALVVRGLLKD